MFSRSHSRWRPGPVRIANLIRRRERPSGAASISSGRSQNLPLARHRRTIARMPRSSSHRPGRPRIDAHDSTVSVHVRVPAKQYDVLYADARQARMNVPELIRRRALTRRDGSREDEREDR